MQTGLTRSVNKEPSPGAEITPWGWFFQVRYCFRRRIARALLALDVVLQVDPQGDTLALPEEIATRRNLAFNCYDEHGDTGFYPHASANVETRGEAVFAARNAIDGIFENSAHGEYPYQSWGINRDPNAALTLDFGREVLLDELRITERADFPHDNYWVKATVEFSDGSRLDIPLVKSAKPQSVTFEPKRVRSLVLKDLIRAEGTSPFPALTQIEAFGTEVK